MKIDTLTDWGKDAIALLACPTSYKSTCYTQSKLIIVQYYFRLEMFCGRASQEQRTYLKKQEGTFRN
jgi:hypothetical protein